MARKKNINVLFAKARDADRRLYGWMRANHDDLLIELGPARVLWRPVLQVITALGLLDEHGKQPSRDTAFRTWRRVRRDVAANRARRQAKAVHLTSDEIAPGVRDLAPQDESTSGMGVFRLATQRRTRLDIRPVRPIGDMPRSAFQRPDTPATKITTGAPMPTVEEADAQIRRVFDTIGATRTPMPKVIRPPSQ